MSQLADRMIRAAKLDAHVYEEVEADTSAMVLGVVFGLFATPKGAM